MKIDYAKLKAEILNDPLNLGYATSIESGADTEIADILNDAKGAGAGSVSLESTTKGQFLLTIAPSVLGFAAQPKELQDKWDRMIHLLSATDTIDIGNPGVSALLDLAIADGVMTPEVKQALLMRAGTRAEVLFGAGASVTSDDVAHALRK